MAVTAALIDGAEGALGPPFDDVDAAASKGPVVALIAGLPKGLTPQGVRVHSIRPVVIGADIHASGSQVDKAWRLADASLHISGGR